MGYVVKSKKLNIIFNENQQKDIFNIWMNPPEELLKNNAALRILSPYLKDNGCETFTDILDMVGFDYEEKKKGLKLTGHWAKWRHQKELFSAAAPIITPGNFMTFRGEDGELIGFFFNGKDMIEYSTYDELKKLEEPFVLKKDLDKTLSKKESVNKVKPKI